MGSDLKFEFNFCALFQKGLGPQRSPGVLGVFQLQEAYKRNEPTEHTIRATEEGLQHVLTNLDNEPELLELI